MISILYLSYDYFPLLATIHSMHPNAFQPFPLSDLSRDAFFLSCLPSPLPSQHFLSSVCKYTIAKLSIHWALWFMMISLPPFSLSRHSAQLYVEVWPERKSKRLIFSTLIITVITCSHVMRILFFTVFYIMIKYNERRENTFRSFLLLIFHVTLFSFFSVGRLSPKSTLCMIARGGGGVRCRGESPRD